MRLCLTHRYLVGLEHEKSEGKPINVLSSPC